MNKMSVKLSKGKELVLASLRGLSWDSYTWRIVILLKFYTAKFPAKVINKIDH